jgi:hypothetical protein
MEIRLFSSANIPTSDYAIYTVVERSERNMAVDPERHARTIASLTDSPYNVIVASSPTEVRLLTGYWPVMGNSIAFFTSDG